MEAVIRFIVTNRPFTLLFFLIVLTTAWIKLPGIRISQYPTVELPTLMIEVVLPGASATEIEQRVVNTIEEKLQNTTPKPYSRLPPTPKALSSHRYF